MCPPGPAVKSLLQAHAHRDSSRRPGPWERPLGCQEGPCPGVAVPRCLQVWAGQLHKARQASPGWPSPYSEEVEVPSAARGRRAGSEARGWLGRLASAPSRSPSSHCPSLVQPEMATCSPLPSRRVPGVSSCWPSAHVPSPSPGPLPQPSSPGALSEAHCPARLYLLGVGGLPEACPSGCMLRPCRAAWRLSSMPPLTVPSRAGPLLPPRSTPQLLKCGRLHLRHRQHRPAGQAPAGPSVQRPRPGHSWPRVTCSSWGSGSLLEGQAPSVCTGDRWRGPVLRFHPGGRSRVCGTLECIPCRPDDQCGLTL